MLTVEYSGSNFDSAWDAIDRGEALDVVVRGWRVPILRRSLPLCAVFFGRERRLNHHRPTEILRIWLFGSVCPRVVLVFNHPTHCSVERPRREEQEGGNPSFLRP